MSPSWATTARPARADATSARPRPGSVLRGALVVDPGTRVAVPQAHERPGTDQQEAEGEGAREQPGGGQQTAREDAECHGQEDTGDDPRPARPAGRRPRHREPD